MLFIIPTPIGNLKDITLRSLEVLQSVDGIICEDSRRTSLLLNHYQIKKPLIVLNDFNETKTAEMIIQKLQTGENLALVSDAGTPLINDPGFKLIRGCSGSGIDVDSLPGACAPIVALTLSSLPPDKFTFLGYPPDKSGHRQKFFQSIIDSSKILNQTFILFIAPFKIIKTLVEMKGVFGDIEIVLAKELTKIHQSVTKETISTYQDFFRKSSPRGEYVLLFNLNHG